MNRRMKTPESWRFQRVANRFKKAAKISGEQQNIKFSSMEIKKHACETVACHAGHYLISDRYTSFQNTYSNGKCLANRNGFILDYHEGIDRIVRALGYKREDCEYVMGFFDSVGNPLELWARQNPKLWGNQNGKWMFGSEGAKAFGKSDRHQEVTIQEIADHWQAVTDRVREQEEQK